MRTMRPRVCISRDSAATHWTSPCDTLQVLLFLFFLFYYLCCSCNFLQDKSWCVCSRPYNCKQSGHVNFVCIHKLDTVTHCTTTIFTHYQNFITPTIPYRWRDVPCQRLFGKEQRCTGGRVIGPNEPLLHSHVGHRARAWACWWVWYCCIIALF